jgi:hypothetical protein
MMADFVDTNSKTSVLDSLLIGIDAEDLNALRRAHFTLEHPSLAARLSSVVGTPIDMAIHLLPKTWYKQIHQAAERAITKALETAVSSMRRDRQTGAREMYYKALIAGSGGAGGLFGLPGILLELPVSTTLMLRSIAEIARDEGEDIHSFDTQLSCIEVFALGGTAESDDAAETGYYGIRLALSSYMSSAISQVAQQGFKADTAPAVLQLVKSVANRFGIVLSERAATQLVPVVGAIGAASVNTIFMHHFQSMARAHFVVRRLERKYGKAFVRENYESF